MSSPVCAVGVNFTNFSKARTCRDKLEAQTGKPHMLRSGHAGSAKLPVSYETVGVMDGCTEGVKYDSPLENEIVAKQCAEGLTRITKMPHEARLIQKRALFSDVYQVVKK